MEQDNLYQRLTWLDEEHRKAKAMITELSSQMDERLTEIIGLRRALSDLEERLARVQTQSLRYSQIEQALNQHKTEIAMLFDQFSQRIETRDENNNKIRQIERERLEPRFADLTAKIEELAAMQKNFGEDHAALKRIEGGQVAFIRGLEETNRRVEVLPPRVQGLEEWTKRSTALISEIQQLAERLQKDRSEAQEAMRRADTARVRQISEWQDQMKSVRREIDDWIAQLKPMLDIPKEVRAYITNLRELEERIKPIEPRLNQWQTVLEESRHKEFDTIKADLEKRWQQHTREWEFLREEWSKRLAAMSLRFDPIEEWRPLVADEFREVREQMLADRQRLLNLIGDVVRSQLEYERWTISRFEQHASDLQNRVEVEKIGQKPKPPKVTVNP